MSALRITTRASAALVITAAFACGTAAMASASPSAYTYICHGVGYGSTSAAAEQAAINDLYASYDMVLGPFYLNSDTQSSNGTWWAEETSNCSGMLR